MKISAKLITHILIFLAATLVWAQEQEVTLNFVPEQTTVNFTLGDALHTVRGGFKLKARPDTLLPDQ
jgi:hypothetical protein